MTTVHQATKALPVVLKPVEDELLSSWITRHAELYRVSSLAMLRHCVPEAVSLRAADLHLNTEQADRIAHIFRSTPAEIRRMTHAEAPKSAARLLASKPIQICCACAHKNARRDAATARSRSSLEGWRITCRVCSSELVELDEHGAPCPRELPAPFTSLWDKALHGQGLFENAIIHNTWPWASPIHVSRLLLVRRYCKSADLMVGINNGRTADLVIPGFDETVRRLGFGPLRQTSLIIPMVLRPALLAAVSIVIDQGPDAIKVLSDGPIGGYRHQFDRIVSQIETENRIRLTVSQLLQS
jgi:TniQ